MRALRTKVSTQQGFSLVELMVALALSGFLMLGLVRVFDSNRQNTLLSDSFARVQESGRMAQTMLSRSLRMAGFMGCGASTAMGAAGSINDDVGFWSNLDTTDTDYEAALADYSTYVTPIDNFDGTDATTYKGFFGQYTGTTTDIEPVADTDVIFIRSAEGSDLTLGNPPTVGTDTLVIQGPQAQRLNVDPGDIVLVTDCDSYARVLSITADGSNKLGFGGSCSATACIDNAATTMAPTLTRGDQLLELKTEVWYVAQSQFFEDSQGNPVNSLFVSDRTRQNAQEIVPYVEDLQFEYAIDTTSPDPDNIADGYFSAAELETLVSSAPPPGISTVEEYITQRGHAVRMQLVVSGEYNVAAPLVEEDMTMRGNGDYAEDGRLRKVYSSVSHIRNNPSVGDLLTTGS